MTKPGERVSRKMGELCRKLKNFTIVELEIPSIQDDEIMQELVGKMGVCLFLDDYSEKDILAILEEHGILRQLREKGFDHIKIAFDTSDHYIHRLALYFEKITEEHLLGEIWLRRSTLQIQNFRAMFFLKNMHELSRFMSRKLNFPMKVLIIEWLRLQNPRQQFDAGRSPMPGQKHPGLGLLHDVTQILIKMSTERGQDGLLNIPEYFHNAWLYSQLFFFIDPVLQGKMMAMRRDLNDDVKKHGLGRVSEAVSGGCLYNETTTSYECWNPEEQMYPISVRLTEYFQHSYYREIVQIYSKEYRYRIAWERQVAPTNTANATGARE
jgi:hypothetical protein